jgi:hypothetical protein
LKNTLKETFFSIQSEEILTDANFFAGGFEGQNFLSAFEQPTMTMDYQDTKIVMQYFINSVNKYNSYARKYIKIPEILASVGGLLKLFVFVFSNFNLPFSRIETFVAIINEVFVQNTPEVIFKKEDNIVVSRMVVGDQSKSTYAKLSVSDLSLKRVNDSRKKLQMKKTFINRSIEIKFLEKLKFIFCASKFKNKNDDLGEKIKFYEKCCDKITCQLDAIKLIKLCQDFHLLKVLMLNEYQLPLFNEILKNKGYFEEEKKDYDLSSSIDALNEKLNNNHPSYTDKKIKDILF